MLSPPNTYYRDQVFSTASYDLRAAHKHAAQITDPWFLCQALSYIAFRTPDIQARDEILIQAFDQANQLAEPNRIVSVSAWPLTVAIEFWPEEEVQRVVDRLMSIIREEPSPVRRVDALLSLCCALQFKPAINQPVLTEFVAACLSPLLSGKPNRKGESRLLYILPLIAIMDPEWAAEIGGKIQSVSKKEEALQLLDSIKGKQLGDVTFNNILGGMVRAGIME